jgi:VWFA-related protein
MTVRNAMAAAAAVATVVASPAAQSQSTFRSGTIAVSVNVSVKAGNVPVSGLGAADFTLKDNGVPQTIDAVGVEAVPIDVTLVLDTSGSAAGAIPRLLADVQKIAGRLRTTDRFRLLTIDTYVHQVLPMQPAGRQVWPTRMAYNGASAVYDALVAGLLTPVDVDRRHLIVAMTDGLDTTSTLDADAVRRVAGRADGVLHIIEVSGEPARAPVPPNWLPRRDAQPDVLQDAARRTGGDFYPAGSLGADVVGAFDRVFEDFRSSYVLRYTPARVTPRGWHELEVNTTRPGKLTVRARRGYFGG